MIEHNAIVRNVKIPDSSYVGFFSYINGDVEIGENVLIGPHVSITSNVHLFNGIHFREKMFSSKIKIGDGCWIAAGCQILPGVEIGKYCLVCANATVTHNYPDKSIIAGVPARVVGRVLPGGELLWD